MMTEQDLEQIELYLQGALSETEAELVSERIKHDPEFKAQMEIIRDLPLALQTDTEGFRSDLKRVISESSASTQKIRSISIKRFILAAAAAICLLFLIDYSLTENEPDDLYVLHFKLPAENISVRNDQNTNENLSNALSAYTEGEYASAVLSFETFLRDNPENQGVRFFYSLALMAVEKYALALENLTILEKNGGGYSQAVSWYLGLLNLKLGEKEQAIHYFEQLSTSKNSYTEESLNILKNLE